MKRDFDGGDIVVFKDKMYRAPHRPYYNAYKGHRFMVSRVKGDPDYSEHLRLACVDEPAIRMLGLVKPEDLRLAYVRKGVARKVRMAFVTGWVKKVIGKNRMVVVEAEEAARMGVWSVVVRLELCKRGIWVETMRPFNYVAFKKVGWNVVS